MNKAIKKRMFDEGFYQGLIGAEEIAKIINEKVDTVSLADFRLAISMLKAQYEQVSEADIKKDIKVVK